MGIENEFCCEETQKKGKDIRSKNKETPTAGGEKLLLLGEKASDAEETACASLAEKYYAKEKRLTYRRLK